MTLTFVCLLCVALLIAAAPEWQPRPKGHAAKALLATTFAALLVAMAVIAYAAPAPVSADIESPLPSEDKDMESD